MNSSSSDRRSERFFAGKGFYIVLFLCAAVIGVSAWMMAAGNRAMDASDVTEVMSTDREVETVIAPNRDRESLIDETQFAPPEVETSAPAEPAEDEPNAAAQSAGTEEIVYIWPVGGEIVREHTLSALKYDDTMHDWRTHRGVDIACEIGAAVSAARGGRIESVVFDDFYGTTVVIDHGDGMRSVYSNLAEETAVSVGDWVDAGTVIGSVGKSALCEIAQTAHLHFEMSFNGVSVDPMGYLAA